MCDSNYKMYGGKKLSQIIPQLCKKKVFTDMLLEEHKEMLQVRALRSLVAPSR